MKNYLKKWDLMRILRLVIGVIVIGQGISAGQWTIVGLGAVFTLLPLFNASMCSIGACSVPVKKVRTFKADEVTYEEVK